MSRSNLNPRHLHNTTGTFNLIVKDRSAFRLSGALQSISPVHYLVASRLSSKPFKLTKHTQHCQPMLPEDFYLIQSTYSGERYLPDLLRIYATLGKPLSTNPCFRDYKAKRVFKTSKDQL